MANSIVGALYKGSDVVVDSSSEKQADLVERWIVVATEVRRRRLRLWCARVGEGVKHEAGQRDRRQRALAAVLGIATDLERPAERCELWSEGADMTGDARLAGLCGEGGYCP